jgi:hypothetical protein
MRIEGYEHTSEVSRAITDAQERPDTPLNGGFGLDLSDFDPPVPAVTLSAEQRGLGARIVRGISYTGERDEAIFVPQRRSPAMIAYINRPA